MTDIYAVLASHGIEYQRFNHPAVFTVEDVARLVPSLPGTQTKNLFLRDEKGRRHFLVVVGHEKQVDLRRLAEVMGSSKLSFASAERLMKYLGVEPGSVSILAVVNDPGRQVEVFVDRSLWTAEVLCCHPLVNTATLTVSREGIQRLLHESGHVPKIIDVPERAASPG